MLKWSWGELSEGGEAIHSSFQPGFTPVPKREGGVHSGEKGWIRAEIETQEDHVIIGMSMAG